MDIEDENCPPWQRMDIAIHTKMLPTRPCHFCLCLQCGCVFADFDVDPDGLVFLVCISFDGYGANRVSASIPRMSVSDSQVLLNMVQRDSIDETAEPILRDYFRQNRDMLWSDALAYHCLL